AFDMTFGGGTDAFVTKLDPSGSTLVYSAYLGGISTDEGRGIAVDAAGNAYVTGKTASLDFPTTVGAFDRTLGGSGDAFVTTLDPSGSGLVYSAYLGNGSDARGFGIAVDATGNAYVTGSGQNGFAVTSGAFDTTFNGGLIDAFVTKLNAGGSALVYSTFLG